MISIKISERPIIIRLLAISLSLVCMNAFSYGVRKIEILKKKDSKDTDTYVLSKTTIHGYNQCVKKIWPYSVTTQPGYGHGKTIYIGYLSDEKGCGSLSSQQEFRIKSIQHPSREAYFLWVKEPSRDPYIIIAPLMPKYHLIWADNKDPKDIKIWVSCVNKYCNQI